MTHQKFLVDFFIKSPCLITKLFKSSDSALNQDMVNEINWKLESNGTPGDDNSYLNGSVYYYSPDKIYTEDAQNVSLEEKSLDEFVAEYKYTLMPDKYEDSISFLVLEDKNGEIFLGEFVGD